MGLNHIKNQNSCYLDLLLTTMTDDFCVSESPSSLWKNEVFHTAIEYSIMILEKTAMVDNNLSDPYFDFSKADYGAIKNKLNSIDWQLVIRSHDTEHAVDVFYQIIYSILEQTVPMKQKKKANAKTPIWYNRQIINLRNRKQKAHKAYKRNKKKMKILPIILPLVTNLI